MQGATRRLEGRAVDDTSRNPPGPSHERPWLRSSGMFRRPERASPRAGRDTAGIVHGRGEHSPVPRHGTWRTRGLESERGQQAIRGRRYRFHDRHWRRRATPHAHDTGYTLTWGSGARTREGCGTSCMRRRPRARRYPWTRRSCGIDCKSWRACSGRRHGPNGRSRKRPHARVRRGRRHGTRRTTRRLGSERAAHGNSCKPRGPAQPPPRPGRRPPG